MNTSPFRFRTPILPAAVFAAAGLFSCLPSIQIIPEITQPGPQDAPQPVSLGEGEMQFVRLSRSYDASVDYAQVLVDEEGVVYLFWKEETYGEGYDSEDYRFRRRFTDGSWDVEERIENSELNFNPVFLWDAENRPCYTYYKDRDTSVLWLSCQEEGGWVETNFSGYAELITSNLSLFLDPPRIVTAYVTLEESYGILHYGESHIFRGVGDARDVQLARDGAGAYYMIFFVYNETENETLLMISESKDKGATWSQPAEITNDDMGPPRFFLARDGTLYLVWSKFQTLTMMYRSDSAGWKTTKIPLGDEYELMFDEVFLGESADGKLWIALWNPYGFFTLHGTVEEGFTQPIRVFEMDTEQHAYNVHAVFGRNGSLFVTGETWKGTGSSEHYIIFGWI